MTRTQTTTRALLLVLACVAFGAGAQTPARPPAALKGARKPKRPRPPRPPYNPNIVLLDPAHGGSDDGARLGNDGIEKDLNFAFANRLKSLLTDKGFTVVLTHSDAATGASGDQRAEIANRSRAVACLLLHATSSGHGVHLFSSALAGLAKNGQPLPENYIAPWDSAQAATLPKSQDLVNELTTSFNGLRVPVVTGNVSVAPIDSFTCPAVAVEIAPEPGGTAARSDAYQRRIAESLVAALIDWRDRMKAQIEAAVAAFDAANAGQTDTSPVETKPRPRSAPAPAHPPEESPLAPEKPARRNPPKRGSPR